ncbi:MAG: hypothetical protein ACKO96_07325 [Flammeovirgaceae bacterium]
MIQLLNPIRRILEALADTCATASEQPWGAYTLLRTGARKLPKYLLLLT